jgi:protein-S-isoprenylcysteine O-methyltransferase Ste14
MPDDSFKLIFLAGLIAAEVIRFPHRMRVKRERRQKKGGDDRTRAIDLALDLLAFAGMEIIPLFYIFGTWLDFADYRLPPWAGWFGTAFFGGVLWLLWRSHADLGQNWSPTVEVTEKQTLVTQGIYRSIRHPIYAAMWLWGIAQALLLQNWIAGLATLVLFTPVYFVRVPREEQMMLDHFGQEYQTYLEHTGRIFPKWEG